MLKPEFNQLIKVRYPNLSELNIAINEWIKAKLIINTRTMLSSELELSVNDKNFRNLAICKTLGATIYLSGKGAESYNDPKKFTEQGIDLIISNYQPAPYPQLNGEFIDNLSALDYLFNIINKQESA